MLAGGVQAMARRFRLLLLLSSIWALSAPPPAQASPAQQGAGTAIVYRCGSAFENLCRFTFDGAAPAQLSSDGKPGGPLYASPSLAADGSRLAFTFGNDVFLADRNASNRSDRFARRAVLVALRPDGGQVATVETIAEATSLRGGSGFYVCGHQFGACIWYDQQPTPGFVNYLFTYGADGSARRTVRRQPAAFAWAGNRMVSDTYDSTTQRRGVCLLVVDDFKCERDIARDPRRSLTTPAVSPNGAWLAVTACGGSETQETCAIALYSMDGTFVRDLTQGPDDVVPVWSPDSSQVAFNRGRAIWLTDRDAGAGSERLLIDEGSQPTWALFGGAPSAAPAPEPAPAPASAPALTNLADELTDWGIPPQDTLQSRIGMRTPTTMPGGAVVTTAEVAQAQRSDAPPLLVDALGDPHPATIPGAVRFPEVGLGGSFDDDVQSLVAHTLEEWTEGDLDTPLVFFCQGAQCWESYNASLRAIHLGYRNVAWYRGGLAAWAAASLPLE
jgi:PQQ-dependent catabolism-associated CXXCW motif protein